jgi:hypothetical protein
MKLQLCDTLQATLRLLMHSCTCCGRNATAATETGLLAADGQQTAAQDSPVTTAQPSQHSPTACACPAGPHQPLLPGVSICIAQYGGCGGSRLLMRGCCRGCSAAARGRLHVEQHVAEKRGSKWCQLRSWRCSAVTELASTGSPGSRGGDCTMHCWGVYISGAGGLG